MVSGRSTVTTFSLGMLPCDLVAPVLGICEQLQKWHQSGMVEEEVYLVVFGLIVGAIVVLGWKQLLNILPALLQGCLRQWPLPVQEHQLGILTWISCGLVKVVKLLYVPGMH